MTAKAKLETAETNPDIVVRPTISNRILVNQGQIVSTSDLNNLGCPECQDKLNFKVTDTKVAGLIPTLEADHCGKAFVAVPSESGSGMQINYAITDPDFSVGETGQRKYLREAKVKTEEPITATRPVEEVKENKKTANKKAKSTRKKQVEATKKGESQDVAASKTTVSEEKY